MARFVVDAVASHDEADIILVVSVSSAEDGRPRGGLREENFAVVQSTVHNGGARADRAVVRVSEGPAGVYCLDLAPMHLSPDDQAKRSIFSVAVSAPPHGGGANYHGQTLTGLDRG